MTTADEEEEPVPRPHRGSLWHYIARSILGSSEAAPVEDEDDAKAAANRRAGIYNFIQVPWNLEPLMVLGYLTCLDCFLTLVTLSPLRVLATLVRFLAGRGITRHQGQELTRIMLVIAVSSLLIQVDMSQTYHSVRNQAMLKLYVIFNVLEIFDKLCASFGQDILDALDAAGGRRRQWQGGLPLDFCIALVYTLAHTLVLFYHSVALNIALNSHNNLLITLLISNNFVELKSNVFKRVERENLFQVSCADIVERFQLSVYLAIVGLQFMFVQKVEATRSEWMELAFNFGMILIAEMCIDWIKHAFVVKFNRIPPKIYGVFIQLLCSDACPPSAQSELPRKHKAAQAKMTVEQLIEQQEKQEEQKADDEQQQNAEPREPSSPRRRGLGLGGGAFSQSEGVLPSSSSLNPPLFKLGGGGGKADGGQGSAAASRRTYANPSDFSALPAARMGFMPLPLLCLVVRVVGHDVIPRLYLGHPSGWLLCALIWLVLCLVKILTSITLLGYACTRCAEAQAGPNDPTALAFLSGIERYTLHGKGIM
jgi:hypothetical protein